MWLTWQCLHMMVTRKLWDCTTKSFCYITKPLSVKVNVADILQGRHEQHIISSDGIVCCSQDNSIHKADVRTLSLDKSPYLYYFAKTGYLAVAQLTLLHRVVHSQRLPHTARLLWQPSATSRVWGLRCFVFPLWFQSVSRILCYAHSTTVCTVASAWPAIHPSREKRTFADITLCLSLSLSLCLFLSVPISVSLFLFFLVFQVTHFSLSFLASLARCREAKRTHIWRWER